MRRVAVTGIGVVTCIGTGRERFWNNLLAGHCGISPVESFDTTRYSVHRGAEIKDFRAGCYISTLDPNCLGRASQFAIASARLALADADLDEATLDAERTGVSMGTTSGESQVIERFDDRYVAGDLARAGAEIACLYPCHVIPAHVAAELDLMGVNVMIPGACAAGNYAIAHAFDILQAGRADLMLAGASDAFSRIAFTGFARLGAIAPEWCCPFDRNRQGLIPGEGAGMLVLEPLDRAVSRGARIYAEIAGYGLSCDAYHMTAGHPEGAGAVRAMEMALRASGLQPGDVSYISAHGTGTALNDRLETASVKRVFGESAYRIPMSSIKSMIGHSMGAASAIEAAACAMSIFDNRIPPTIHLEAPDPECDLDYVPNQAREHRVEAAMNNAYAFGGNNASLILKRCQS